MLKRTVIVAALMFGAAGAGAGACPLCKDSLPNDQAVGGTMKNNLTSRGENISSGINSSIVVMFVGLFSALGMAGMALVRGSRGGRGKGE